MTKKHTAKRIDAGWYEYRGHTISDAGSGNSVAAAQARAWARWRIYVGTSFATQTPFGGNAFTLKDAKQKIDQALSQQAAL